MNKNGLFNTIINNYNQISDESYIQKSDTEVKPNGNTEKNIMNDLGSVAKLNL
ncbi:hypothetical protein IGX37_00975 [Staphylococcus aureus]|uniref:Uncharacterized protein n=1 Tax=Staphylococcus aureus TaxID=1280 RepID=A0A0N7ELB6_STAAU|nr:hypothetical protein [Staphylococcus aureus]ALF44664.1 hypothetical protein [Staphylococcus aureus]MCT6527578.1 hypothetical protein [Staphylococcus aureus]MCT6530240.1 hypothetical protein [Staphylococcus aureus]MCT6551625.1 hypothetical protein [Staphylococcus aureus]MCT6554511.1 hypothetical protein [Staphylococcus aureus]